MSTYKLEVIKSDDYYIMVVASRFMGWKSISKSQRSLEKRHRIQEPFVP